jgi:putative salt-induced outer membrane protein YdiY
MTMRLRLCVAVLLTSLAWLPAAADQVTLTNGDRLSGSIVELSSERLRIKTEFLGELSIPRKAIASFTAEEPVHVTLTDKQVVVGTMTSQDGSVEIQIEPEPITVPRDDIQAVRSSDAQAAYEKSLHPGFFDFWEFGANVGFSTRGGGGTTTTSIAADAKRHTSKDEFTFHYQSLLEREQSGAVVNDDKARASAIYKRDLSKRFYCFGATDFDYDALQNLNLRWVLGGGVGWHAVKKPRVRLDVGGGGALNQEFFEAEPTRRSVEALVGDELTLHLTDLTSFEERWYFYPNLSDPGQYRVQLSMSYVIRLNSWLSWQLRYGNHYLSDPPPGADKNDLLLTSGLRFSFGKGGGEKPK